MHEKTHYLEHELYDLIKRDETVFNFLQLGSLDGIWYWDLEENQNEWMSPRFWEILGYDYKEKKHLSSEWQDMIIPEDLIVAVNNFKKHCNDSSHPYDQVVRYHHKDGSLVWVRCRGIAIRDQLGKPKRMLGAHTDLTALMKTEEKLKQKTSELEAINQELLEALKKVRLLEGLLPICSYCKKIRDSENNWTQMESYITSRTGSLFSHGICPDCQK